MSSTSTTRLRNYKLSANTIAQLEACVQELGLPSATLGVKVAIAYLYNNRDKVDLKPILVDIRSHDRTSEFASNEGT